MSEQGPKEEVEHVLHIRSVVPNTHKHNSALFIAEIHGLSWSEATERIKKQHYAAFIDRIIDGSIVEKDGGDCPSTTTATEPNIQLLHIYALHRHDHAVSESGRSLCASPFCALGQHPTEEQAAVPRDSQSDATAATATMDLCTVLCVVLDSRMARGGSQWWAFATRSGGAPLGDCPASESILVDGDNMLRPGGTKRHMTKVNPRLSGCFRHHASIDMLETIKRDGKDGTLSVCPHVDCTPLWNGFTLVDREPSFVVREEIVCSKTEIPADQHSDLARVASLETDSVQAPAQQDPHLTRAARRRAKRAQKKRAVVPAQPEPHRPPHWDTGKKGALDVLLWSMNAKATQKKTDETHLSSGDNGAAAGEEGGEGGGEQAHSARAAGAVESRHRTERAISLLSLYIGTIVRLCKYVVQDNTVPAMSAREKEELYEALDGVVDAYTRSWDAAVEHMAKVDAEALSGGDPIALLNGIEGIVISASVFLGRSLPNLMIVLGMPSDDTQWPVSPGYEPLLREAGASAPSPAWIEQARDCFVTMRFILSSDFLSQKAPSGAGKEEADEGSDSGDAEDDDGEGDAAVVPPERPKTGHHARDGQSNEPKPGAVVKGRRTGPAAKQDDGGRGLLWTDLLGGFSGGRESDPSGRQMAAKHTCAGGNGRPCRAPDRRILSGCMVTVECTTGCAVTLHNACWKDLEVVLHHGTSCITPNCWGTLKRVTSVRVQHLDGREPHLLWETTDNHSQRPPGKRNRTQSTKRAPLPAERAQENGESANDRVLCTRIDGQEIRWMMDGGQGSDDATSDAAKHLSHRPSLNAASENSTREDRQQADTDTAKPTTGDGGEQREEALLPRYDGGQAYVKKKAMIEAPAKRKRTRVRNKRQRQLALEQDKLRKAFFADPKQQEPSVDVSKDENWPSFFCDKVDDDAVLLDVATAQSRTTEPCKEVQPRGRNASRRRHAHLAPPRLPPVAAIAQSMIV